MPHLGAGGAVLAQALVAEVLLATWAAAAADRADVMAMVAVVV